MDYRLTKFEKQKLQNIKVSKGNLLRKIRIKHPRTKDFYSLVRNDYKNEFMSIYNNKCVYCGVSVDLLPKKMFEIDHFVNAKSERFTNGSRRNKDGMSNLVLSCYDCNRKKSNFSIDRKIEYLLHGDYDKIKDILHRDTKNYAIVIGDIGSLSLDQQTTIRDSYNKLMLGNYVHRLDYLLMSMRHLADRLNLPDKSLFYERSILLNCIDILQKKRNRF